MTNMLQARSNGERAHTYWQCIHIISVKLFIIKDREEIKHTNDSSSSKSKKQQQQQTEYKLMVGCCKVGHTIHMEMLSRKDQFIT